VPAAAVIREEQVLLIVTWRLGCRDGFVRKELEITADNEGNLSETTLLEFNGGYGHG
jgi:hypothetical protein